MGIKPKKHIKLSALLKDFLTSRLLDPLFLKLRFLLLRFFVIEKIIGV